MAKLGDICHNYFVNEKKPHEKVIKAVAEAPARAVDESLKMTKKVADTPPVRVVQKYLGGLGPGLVTGAADDDPSGIATYSQAGASFGYQFLWMALFSLPFMAIVQEMCARIGLVTGRGLAGVLKSHYPRYILGFCTLLLLVANTINIGADIGAMASSTNLILPKAPFFILTIFFTVITLILQIFIPYHKYAKYLKILTLALLAYVVAFFMVEHSWIDVVKGLFIPRVGFDQETLYLVVAILGTTISPYLFFWEASQEVEQKIDEGNKTIKERECDDPKEIRNMRKDVYSGMTLSNLIMFFIIGLAGATLYNQGIAGVETTRQAAEALRPLAGNATYYLFTIGIIGTGLLAIPVLAGSASYAISEMFGWQGNLSKKLNQAYSFYGVIIIAVVLGLIMNYFTTNPVKILIFAAVLNGLIAPILIALITLVSNNKKIMGPMKNSLWRNIFGWVIVAIMAGIGIVMLISLIKPNLLF